MHEKSDVLVGVCIGVLAACLLALACVWCCAEGSAAEPPVELPELAPAAAATLERWSLPRVLTGLVPLPVEGVRCLARSYISEARFEAASWARPTSSARTAHGRSDVLLGVCIGALAAGVLALAFVWCCAGRSAAEPPVEQPELAPAAAATSERCSLPRVLTGVVPLPVEGLRPFARSYISEARFKTTWHAYWQEALHAERRRLSRE